MSNEYLISHVSDFLKVPKEKRSKCLKEFTEYLSLMSAFSAIGMEFDSFIWVDDDKNNATVRIEVKDE